MQIFVRKDGADSYTVAAKRTRPNEQLMAGFTDVPRAEVARAAELTVQAMRGEEVPERRRKWQHGM
jgi:hypothetical protein